MVLYGMATSGMLERTIDGSTAMKPRLYGAPYSVYVRSARLALEEKGVAYELVPVDIFAAGGPPAEHLARHPFGRIPAFEHDGFALYETGAIVRYVDEAFDGPPLQPGDVRRRARMNQAIGILDSYAYRTLVWDIFVERVRAPANGRTSDEAKIAEALPRASTCLQALAAIMADGPWLAGPALTLADLHALPMVTYFAMAAEARALLGECPRISHWLEHMRERPSVAATRSPLE
jgi:glutathione S-transferase